MSDSSSVGEIVASINKAITSGELADSIKWHLWSLVRKLGEANTELYQTIVSLPPSISAAEALCELARSYSCLVPAAREYAKRLASTIGDIRMFSISQAACMVELLAPLGHPQTPAFLGRCWGEDWVKKPSLVKYRDIEQFLPQTAPNGRLIEYIVKVGVCGKNAGQDSVEYLARYAVTDTLPRLADVIASALDRGSPRAHYINTAGFLEQLIEMHELPPDVVQQLLLALPLFLYPGIVKARRKLLVTAYGKSFSYIPHSLVGELLEAVSASQLSLEIATRFWNIVKHKEVMGRCLRVLLKSQMYVPAIEKTPYFTLFPHGVVCLMAYAPRDTAGPFLVNLYHSSVSTAAEMPTIVPPSDLLLLLCWLWAIRNFPYSNLFFAVPARLVDCPDERVQAYAVNSLGAWGSPSAKELLERKKTGGSDFVQSIASKALLGENALPCPLDIERLGLD